MKKLTNKEMFANVIAIVRACEIEKDEKSVLVEFLEKQVDALNKKAENKKPTKAQEENEKIKVELVNALVLDEKGLTISDLQTLGFDYSNQKLSALLNQLYKDGLVEKEVGKDRKTVFKLIQEEEEKDDEVQMTDLEKNTMN